MGELELDLNLKDSIKRIAKWQEFKRCNSYSEGLSYEENPYKTKNYNRMIYKKSTEIKKSQAIRGIDIVAINFKNEQKVLKRYNYSENDTDAYR